MPNIKFIFSNQSDKFYLNGMNCTLEVVESENTMYLRLKVNYDIMHTLFCQKSINLTNNKVMQVYYQVKFVDRKLDFRIFLIFSDICFAGNASKKINNVTVSYLSRIYIYIYIYIADNHIYIYIYIYI